MVRLRISACNIDAKGFSPFLKALAQNDTLESVDASENAIGSQVTKHLAAVDWACLPPAVLFWTLRRCKLRACDIAGIAAALPSVPRLQLLDVSDNACGEAAFVNLMACVGDHDNIAALRLQWSSLGIGAGRAAATMLQKASCNLQLLDLSWNHLGDSGVSELCQGLKDTATLRRLFLSHNNLSSIGCKALASVMHESGGGAVDVLEELDVSYNNCRFDGGTNALSRCVTHCNIVTPCRSDSGVEALLSVISINSRIHTLNLTKTGVGSAGVFKKLESLCGDVAQHNVTSLLAECVRGGCSALFFRDVTRGSSGTPASAAATSCPKPFLFKISPKAKPRSLRSGRRWSASCPRALFPK
jgi:hypothetical protein